VKEARRKSSRGIDILLMSHQLEVARDGLAQMIEIGFSKNCAQRIGDVAYSSDGSRFKLGEDFARS